MTPRPKAETRSEAPPKPHMDRELRRLTVLAAKAAEARAALPPGSSRARVTTANARWARFAEARDRRERELNLLREREEP
jgi:hypothetical protein